MVTVIGTNFVRSYGLFCRFGTEARAATYDSAVQLRCEAPPVASNGSVALEISNNNNDYTASGLFFDYYGTTSAPCCTSIRADCLWM